MRIIYILFITPDNKSIISRGYFKTNEECRKEFKRLESIYG